MIRKNMTVKLNQYDFVFLALENVFTSFASLMTMRFKTKQSVSEIRAAMRYMLSMYPRLRSIVEPTLFSYRLKILDDHDEKVDILFNHAFRVQRNLFPDTDDYLIYQRNLLNESNALEQGLPIKIRFLPDDEKPVLLFTIHHLVGDAISVQHLYNSLLSYLNGKKPPLLQLDSPKLTPAFLEKPFYKIPIQMYRSYKLFREDLRKLKHDKIVSISNKSTDFMGPVDMHQHMLSHNLETIKLKSKELDCSITVFLLTALTMALGKQVKNGEGNVIGIILGVNFRPFFNNTSPIFGNYASTYMIRIRRKYWNQPKQVIKVIKSQISLILNRYKKKEMLFPMLIGKSHTFVGRKNYARAVGVAKKRGLIPLTCAVGTGGSVDILNSHGSNTQVSEAIGIIPHHGLFIAINSLDGWINTNYSYPEAEFTRSDIKGLIHSFEDEIGVLLQ